MRLSTRTTALVALAAFLLALGIAGESDISTEEREFAHYCEMVAGGYWPDFNSNASTCPTTTEE